MFAAICPPRLFWANSRSRGIVFIAPNNQVRSHITAAKPPLTALHNSRAPTAALGRQELVRRVSVCKSMARTHSVSPTLDLHNRRAEPEPCSRSHRVRSACADALTAESIKAAAPTARALILSSVVLADAVRPGRLTRIMRDGFVQ